MRTSQMIAGEGILNTMRSVLIKERQGEISDRQTEEDTDRRGNMV